MNGKRTRGRCVVPPRAIRDALLHWILGNTSSISNGESGSLASHLLRGTALSADFLVVRYRAKPKTCSAEKRRDFRAILLSGDFNARLDDHSTDRVDCACDGLRLKWVTGHGSFWF